MNLARLLEDTAQVLADHDEARERLYSAARQTGGRDQIRFGVLRASGTSKPDASLRLAVMPATAHHDLLKEFANAGSEKRSELLIQQRTRLFSIVFAQYRPGPAFLPGHTLSPGSLTAKLVPGGETWDAFLTRLYSEQSTPFTAQIARLARQCARLDTATGDQVGSGFLLPDGTLVTAGHVVNDPGCLFKAAPGNPWVRYNQVNGPQPSEANIKAAKQLPIKATNLDLALIAQSDDWREQLASSKLAPEFGVLAGFPLQTEPIAEADLRNRPVAVLAHPLSGNAGGAAADVDRVYGDAELGVKRFMPGKLDDLNPLIVQQGGQALLSHDCSTLGGASGGCLIDLLTGKALGVHITGAADLGNRAVPAWTLSQTL